MTTSSDFQIEWIGLLEVRNKKVLMTRENNKDLFQLPGGGKEGTETDLETLEREIMEELGVSVKNPNLFDSFILPGRHENVMIKFTIYTAVIPEELVPGEEINEIRWVDSQYEKEGIDIGNPLKLRLLARLLQEKLID